MERTKLHYTEKSEKEIEELAFYGAHKKYGDKLPKEIEERLNKELKLIIENGFATIYLIAQRLVKKSNKDKYIVGTCGTICSSIVAYCIGITEVDPIKYDIPFETFAGLNGEKVSDINLNFVREYQKKAKEYVKRIIEDLLIGQNERKIYEFVPIEYSDEKSDINVISTDFDYSLNNHSLSLNILRDNDVTILHRLKEVTGIEPTSIPLDDEETLKLIIKADTIGISEFSSDFVKNLILKTKPYNFKELIKISGLSHGTDVWNKKIEELIENNAINLSEIISCRDDIMNYLIKQGIEREIAFSIMETVRKGMFTSDKEPKWEEYKQIMKEHNVPNWYIESCENINYLFPKAHIVNSVINNFRIAYYKVHYPKEFKRVISEFEYLKDNTRVRVSLFRYMKR